MKPQPQPVLDDDSSGKALVTEKRELIGERQGKKLYYSEKPDLVVQEFTSNGSDDPKKRSKTRDLRVLRNEISSYLFEYLQGFHIPNHYVQRRNETEMVVKRLSVIPLSVKIYNAAIGTIPKRFGISEGTALEFPIIEHYYVNGAKTPSWVNESHVYAFNVATPEELRQMNRIAAKVNAVLRGLCNRRQLMLVDLHLEFGRYRGQIMLGDELSPMNCHFWDLETTDKHLRDRFLPEQDQSEQTMAELCDRLQLKV